MTFKKETWGGPLSLGLDIFYKFPGGSPPPLGNFIITEGSDPIITESGNNWVIE